MIDCIHQVITMRLNVSLSLAMTFDENIFLCTNFSHAETCIFDLALLQWQLSSPVTDLTFFDPALFPSGAHIPYEANFFEPMYVLDQQTSGNVCKNLLRFCYEAAVSPNQIEPDPLQTYVGLDNPITSPKAG